MKFQNTLFIIYLYLTCNLSAQTFNQTMLRIPDSGQNMSYTNTFGEDSDFNFNIPFYVDNGNGTILDTITGLFWQKIDGGEMTIENAITYCDTLTLSGFTDWRLPSALESFSILNHQNVNPSINTTFFPVTGAEYWWTNDRQFNDNNKIWCTNAGGGIGNHLKTETISAGGTKKFHVRAVRNPNAINILSSHFLDNQNGTILDNNTQLIWQKSPFTDTLTWENALKYADSLTLGGFTDWRLPNIKELQSITDISRSNPSLNINYFSVSNAKKYWSSTTLPNQTSKAWYLNTQFGITTYDLKTNKNSLICVRGIPNDLTTNLNTSFVPTSNFIYPNPFHSKIHNYSFEMNLKYELYSILGELKLDFYNIENQDFSSLPKGIYFLKIIGSNVEIVKIVKE